MTTLVRAELMKLRTTRDLWWMVAGTLVLTAGIVALTMNRAGADGFPRTLMSDAGVRSVIASASTASLLTLMLGITSMTGEFRHGTATTTFLVAPIRQRPLIAKMAAIAVIGLLLAALSAAVTLAIGLPWLDSRGVPLGDHTDDVVLPLVGALVVTPLAGIIGVGVGVGALVRQQPTAVTAALVWTVVIETAVAGALPELYRWLPGGASAALTGSPTPGHAFPMAGGALVMVGYAIAFAVAGRTALVRRDLA